MGRGFVTNPTPSFNTPPHHEVSDAVVSSTLDAIIGSTPNVNGFEVVGKLFSLKV